MKEKIESMNKTELIDALMRLESMEEYLMQLYNLEYAEKVGEQITNVNDIELIERVENILHGIYQGKLYIRDRLRTHFNTFVM